MFKYAARTLFGFWAFIPVLGMYITNIVLQGAAWAGDAVFVVRGTALIAWLVGIALAGVSAVDAARLTVAGRLHHVADPARGFKVFAAVTLATVIPVTLVHMASIGAAFVMSDVVIRDFGPIVLAVLAQVTSLFWFTAFGSAVGRFLSPIIAGPVAAVAAYLLQLIFMGMTASEPTFRVLGDTGASVSQVGLTWNLTHLLLQILILTITSLVLLAIPRTPISPTLALFAAASERGLPNWKALAGFTFVIIAFICSIQLVPGRPMQTNDAVPDHCFQGETEICVFAEHADIGTSHVRYLDSMYQTAREKGYEALIPDRVVEISVRGPEAATGISGSTRFIPPIAADEEFSEHALFANASVPMGCAELFGNQEPPERYFQDWDAITATWSALMEIDDPAGATRANPLTPAEVEEVVNRWNECDL